MALVDLSGSVNELLNDNLISTALPYYLNEYIS